MYSYIVIMADNMQSATSPNRNGERRSVKTMKKNKKH